MRKSVPRGRVKITKKLKKYVLKGQEPQTARDVSSELNLVFAEIPFSESFLYYKPGDTAVSVIVHTDNKHVAALLRKKGFVSEGTVELTVSAYRSEDKTSNQLPGVLKKYIRGAALDIG